VWSLCLLYIEYGGSVRLGFGQFLYLMDLVKRTCIGVNSRFLQDTGANIIGACYFVDVHGREFKSSRMSRSAMSKVFRWIRLAGTTYSDVGMLDSLTKQIFAK
jgi:hypothetical protein